MKFIHQTVLIYNELAEHLSGEFTTSELMQAAQALLDLSKNDFATKSRAIRSYHNYYTQDITEAFSKSTFKILSREHVRDGRHERVFSSLEMCERVHRIKNGLDESAWEF